MRNMTIKPDLQTRESVMTAAGRVQMAVTTPGGVFYVKIEAKCKENGRYNACALDEATHVFISEKGYGTQRLGTYYPPKQGHSAGRFYEDQIGGAVAEVVEAVAAHVNGEQYDSDSFIVTAEDRCGMCGRKLEDPKSVERGIGPECAGKPTGSKILHASAFAAQQALPTTPEALGVAGEGDENKPAPFNPVDDNMSDMARVECGIDLTQVTARQLTILKYAVAEEIAIRQMRDPEFSGHLAEIQEAMQS